jgi:hypothetical protein
MVDDQQSPYMSLLWYHDRTTTSSSRLLAQGNAERVSEFFHAAVSKQAKAG